MTSLLELMSEVVDESAFGGITGGIIGNENELARRLKRISNRVIQEYAEKFPWRELWKTGTITLEDGVSEYALPGDFSYYHMGSAWNGNVTLPVGILSPDSLAYLDGINLDSTPSTQFYIRGIKNNRINIRPTPTSSEDGQVVTFQYQSTRAIRPKTWIASMAVTTTNSYCFYNGNYYYSTSSGTAGSTAPTHTSGSVSDGGVTWTYYDGAYDRFLADTDEINLNEGVFTQACLERLSNTTGQQVFPIFESRILAEWSRQAPAQVICAAGGSDSFLYANNGKVIFSTGR